MSLLIVYLRGRPYQLGRQHGAALKEQSAGYYAGGSGYGLLDLAASNVHHEIL